MIIDRRANRLLGNGNYAHIFQVEGKACKLFLAGPEITPRQTRAGRRLVFEGQCEAYQILSSDPWLQGHAATYYGTCNIEDVIDEDGNSVKGDYLLDCCYAVELCDLGNIVQETGFYENEARLSQLKYGHLKRYYGEDVREAERRFKTLGITPFDSSVMYYSVPDQFKFIDFEMDRPYY